MGAFDATSAVAVEGENWTFAKSYSEEAQLIGKYPNIDFIVGAFYDHKTGGDNGNTLSFQARGTDTIPHPGGAGKN